MRKGLFFIVLFFNLFDNTYAQTQDGVVSFDVPAKNSLKFNKFLINPTFSFIREDESFISFLNKRQWTGFEDASTAYFFSYSGKFREQNGIAFGAFQRNYGVMTTFGAVGNFARNVEMSNNSNFTFGLNLAYVNSGLNTGNVKVNDPNDPSLQNVPKNSSFTVTPGINYSTGFIDLGISANNIFFYNFNNGVITDDPMKGVGAHFMYTGYVYNSGFLENAKFSALIKGEMAKEKTILSGSVLFNAPRGFWAQAGYNNVYGVSGGLGVIIAKKISLGYTLEKGLGNFNNFGLSHEITLAYKLKGYGDFEDAGPVVKATKKTNPYVKPVAVKRKSPAELKKERDAQLALKAQQDKDRLEAERLRREKELAEAKAAAEEQARIKAEQEKALAEARLKAEEEARLRAEQDKNSAVSEAERLRREKEAAAAQAKLDADAKAREAAEQLKAEQERARLEAERLRKEKADADARAKAEADAKALELAEQQKAEQERARLEAERLRKEKEDADSKTKAEEEDRLRREAEAKARLEAAKTAEDKELDNLTQVIDDSKKYQTETVGKFEALVNDKEKELIDLRKENDLSDQGVVTQTKEVEFQSSAAANRAIESLKSEITENARNQEARIKEFESLAFERLKKVPSKNDLLNQSYAKTLEKLKADKIASDRQNAELLSRLERIKTETEIEKKRRIKRAQFDSNQTKYVKDRATLKSIKETTSPTGQVYKPEDFDFGDGEQSNMQIIKNIENVESGFYMVIAVHKDEAKRDAFIKKAIEAGQTNIDFFYNVATGTYYIYYQKFSEIQEADNAMSTKGSKPYNGKMTIIKIE